MMPGKWQGWHSPPGVLEKIRAFGNWGQGGTWDIQVGFQVYEVLEGKVDFFWIVPKEAGMHLIVNFLTLGSSSKYHTS